MSWVENAVYFALTTLTGGIIYLIRKVFTNEKKVAILEAEIKTREDYRKERDEKLDVQLKEIRDDIKNLLVK